MAKGILGALTVVGDENMLILPDPCALCGDFITSRAKTGRNASLCYPYATQGALSTRYGLISY